MEICVAKLLISFVFSKKKSEIPATACRNLEGISKAPSRIQYPEHSRIYVKTV